MSPRHAPGCSNLQPQPATFTVTFRMGFRTLTTSWPGASLIGLGTVISSCLFLVSLLFQGFGYVHVGDRAEEPGILTSGFPDESQDKGRRFLGLKFRWPLWPSPVSSVSPRSGPIEIEVLVRGRTGKLRNMVHAYPGLLLLARPLQLSNVREGLYPLSLLRKVSFYRLGTVKGRRAMFLARFISPR